MTLHMTPTKLSLSPDRILSTSSTAISLHDAPTPNSKQTGNSNSNASATNNRGTVLYKTLSPRKKFDQFGLDRTDYKAYCLSTTVFPTAVKATLLGELHDSNPHACGFDIVDKPTADAAFISSSIPSCNTSVINAPPPTAVTSHRSAQSAPVVAFVEIPSGETTNMASMRHRHPSAFTTETKSTANSQVFSDVTTSDQDGDRYQPRPSNPDSHNPDIHDDVNGRGVARGRVSHPRTGNGSAPRSSLSSLTGYSLVGGAAGKFQRKRLEPPPTKTSGKRQMATGPKVQSFSRLDESRLIRYEWKSRESRVEEDKKDGGDIRDTMYLNTFCPEERPVRFNKLSLPRIGRSSRQRPWTVSESKFSSRSAMALVSNSHNNISRLDRTVAPSGHPSHQTTLRGTGNNRHGFNNGGVSKSAGHLKLRQQQHQQQQQQQQQQQHRHQQQQKHHQHHAWREQAVIDANNHHNKADNDDNDNHDDDGDDDDDNNDDDDDDKENDNGNLGSKPLLEIRSFLPSSALGDQREKLKGKNGCLNSRVKQCVRFVRYRERLERHEDNRPLKSEHGKYRPFSKTDVRGHNPSRPAPTPELKLQQSVESYQQYMENIARQTHLSSPKPNFSFRSGGGGGFNPMRARPGPKLVGTSLNFESGDPSSGLATFESSRPDGVLGSGRISSDTPRPQNSAIYTKDVSAVGQALDIKRISPVPTVNRVVPGTSRVVVPRGSNSPRVILAGAEEGVGAGGEVEADGGGDGDDAVEQEGREPGTSTLNLTPGQHGDTIVLPRAFKSSECPSEYSLSKDD